MIETSASARDANGGAGDALRHRQSELAAAIERLTGRDGVQPSAIAPLTLHRSSAPSPPVYGVQKPTFCIVAQGCKQAVLGDNLHLHDPARYLLVSVDLPISAQVIEATPEVPYLGFCLNIEPREIGALLLDMEPPESGSRSENARREAVRPMTAPGLSLSRTDAPLLDAVLRLLRLLDTPQDIPVLAPLALREILYRLVTGEQGLRLRQIAQNNSPTQRVAEAIDWLKRHYAEPLSIEEIAHQACMSPSSLHHHFKAVTALSPLQYQKHLRLQQARRLMLSDGLDAAAAGYQVGYSSPSQFSREYHHLFGAPPLRDMARLRGAS